MDEPTLDGAPSNPALPAIGERVRRLLGDRLYGVLCTQGEGQPYGSVVAFVAAPELDRLYFATPETTRKFKLINRCPRVAMVVHDGGDQPLMASAGLTATGTTAVLSGDEREQAARQLAGRHPQLTDFFAAPTTAVIRLDVVRYFFVERFQEVSEWAP